MPAADFLPLLQELFGTQAAVRQASLLKDHTDYQVWKLTLTRPALELVLKLGGPRAEYNCHFERIAAIHRRVRAETGVPVAEVLAADESCTRWPWRFLVKQYVLGVEWAEAAGQPGKIAPAALDILQQALGQSVAALHTIGFAGFGAIENNGQVAPGLGSLTALRQHAGQILAFDPAGQDYFERVLAANASLFTTSLPPVLAHEDLHGFNILLTQAHSVWQIAAILDFEKAWAGHAEADLARMELWRMAGPAFWRGYLETGCLAESYVERRPLYQMLWCLEYAQNTADHLRDTQALCRHLGLPLITGFRPLQIQPA